MTRTAPALRLSGLQARSRRLPRGPWVTAALFVLPYFVIMLGWAFSNPPGAAPDESDHLIKSIGVGHLQIGSTYTGPPVGPGLVAERNASISRVVDVPAKLAPSGYSCFAFQPDQTAACLPSHRTTASGSVAEVTPLGSYPPFVYLPMGLAVRLTDTPSQAFLVGRVVCSLMATVLLMLGAGHLVRWLGRRALLGAFVGLTPMVVFTSAMLGTSGIETSAAFAVAAITVAALRRPESLREPGTQLLFGAVGSALMLSRQLGAVTLSALLLLLALRLGWRFFWTLIKEHRPAFVGSCALLGASAASIVYWERNYDHPNHIGSVTDRAAVHGLDTQASEILRSAFGQFGWLDTDMPGWALSAWIILAVLLTGIAIAFGSAADRRTLVAWLLATVVLTYFTYAAVFFPIQAGIQGRHVLPFFMLVPLLAGVAAVERLGSVDPLVARRLFTLTAGVMPVLQAVSVYLNARRYAVGAHGPLYFLGSSAWRPAFGWTPWLALGFLGALALAAVIIWCRSDVEVPYGAEFSGVER